MCFSWAPHGKANTVGNPFPERSAWPRGQRAGQLGLESRMAAFPKTPSSKVETLEADVRLTSEQDMGVWRFLPNQMNEVGGFEGEKPQFNVQMGPWHHLWPAMEAALFAFQQCCCPRPHSLEFSLNADRSPPTKVLSGRCLFEYINKSFSLSTSAKIIGITWGMLDLTPSSVFKGPVSSHVWLRQLSTFQGSIFKDTR